MHQVKFLLIGPLLARDPALTRILAPTTRPYVAVTTVVLSVRTFG